MPTQHPLIEANILERLQMLPRFHVMLHNDDFHDMDHVVRALLQTVLALSVDEAVRIMFEAHTSGVAHVITCPRETAEFYCDGLKRFGLISTLEPA